MTSVFGKVFGLGLAFSRSCITDGDLVWDEIYWKLYLGPWLLAGHFRVTTKRKWYE